MKNLLILSILFFASLSAKANDGTIELLADITNKTLILDPNALLDGNINISIGDFDGKILFNDSYTSDEKIRKYDLSNLSIGTYTLMIENDIALTTKKVYISNANLLIDDAVEVVNKPSIIASGESWIIKNNSDQVIDFSISDENNVIASQSLIPGEFDKKINISNLSIGIYTITYRINNREYYKSMNI